MIENTNGTNGIEETVTSPPAAATTTPTTATATEELSTAEILMQQHTLPEKQASKAMVNDKQPEARGDLDLTSSEAFPSLGGPRKAAAAAPSSWGAGMVAHVANGRATRSNTKNTGTAEAPGEFTPAVQGSGGQTTIYLLPAQKKPVGELRRPLAELVKEIRSNTGTKIDVQQTSTQTSVFIVSGNEANRQRAVRELYREMCASKSENLTIPVIARPHIIGKGGLKVQELEKSTLTKIRVPPMQAPEGPPAEYDDEETIDITIEGDEYGVRTAVAKIKEIVAERTVSVTTRISDVPGECYPFLQGPHGKNIEEFEKKVQKVTIPDYFFTAKSSPFSPPSGPIMITGEKGAVQEVRAEIEQMVEKIKSAGYHSVIFPVTKMKHRLFTSNQGRLIHDTLAASGCTIILPPGGAYDGVVIYGPADKIPIGYQETQKNMDSYQYFGIDVCKAYPRATSNAKLQARDVTRHLSYQGVFQELQAEFGADITIPTREELFDLQSNCVIHLITKSKESLAGAKARIQEIYSKLLPDRLVRFDVEPLYHRLITGKDGKGVRRVAEKYPGVSLLLPENWYDPEIILLHDGPSGDLAEIASTLEEAKKYLLEQVDGQKFEVAERVISDIPQHLHRKIQGEGNSTLRALNPSSVHVHFGAPTVRPGKAALAASPNDNDRITVRGPKANVESTINSIQAFVKSIPEDGNVPIVTEPFPYPSHLSGHLIGAKRANINKLRTELAVEVNLKEGQGEIKGIQVAVDAAKRKLSSQIKELLDKAVDHLKVPQKFHSAIIGAGGNSVRKLQTRYGVRIMFPRSSKNGGASDTDGADGPSKQDADEVVIMGNKDGVSKARAEIVALLEYEMEKSHTATVPVTSRAIEFVFKNAAKEIKQLREDSDVRIDIPQGGVREPDEKLTIKIRGTRDEVERARTILSKIVKEAEQTTSRTISVEKKYHRSLIGRGGQTLKEIVVGAGGPDDKQAFARMVRFPHQDSETDEITVQGNAGVVEKIIKAIEKIVAEKENQISITVDVAPEKHRQLIGREGSIRKELEARFKVTIGVPRQRTGQSTSPDIKITGLEEDVQKAKEYILELVKEPEGETIQVPLRLYHIVADGGHFARRLQWEFKVTVDHAGQTRPSWPTATRPELNGSLPLITDDNDSSQNFTWEVVGQPQVEGDFPWVVRGKPEAVAKAKAEIEKAVATAEQQSSIGYLVLPDPSKFRFVVGLKGAQVDKIRRDTGCRVTVPRGQGVGEPITIHGSKEGVEKAKDIILGLVKGGGANGESTSRGHRR